MTLRIAECPRLQQCARSNDLPFCCKVLRSLVTPPAQRLLVRTSHSPMRPEANREVAPSSLPEQRRINASAQFSNSLRGGGKSRVLVLRVESGSGAVADRR